MGQAQRLPVSVYEHLELGELSQFLFYIKPSNIMKWTEFFPDENI